MTRTLSVLLLAGASTAALAQSPVTLGVMFRTGGQTSGLNPILYDINLATGAATNPRNINVNNTVGLAIDPATGTLYGLTDQFGRINNISGQGGKNLVFSVNPVSGAATAIGRVDPTGIFQVFEGDLAFSPVDGSFWGVTTLINTARLFTIDKFSGAATLGAVVQPAASIDLDISAMTFDAAGQLYLLDTRYPVNPGPALVLRVDKDTGEILRTWNTGVVMGTVAGMTFANGQLFITDGDTGGTNRLYRFDLSTAQLTDIGPTNAAGGIYQGLAGLAHGCLGAPCAPTAACDDIDFNNNNVFPEDQDVIDFFNVLSGADCPACNDIDFNNNQVFPEDQDVIDFFNVLAGAECS
jgi:hypothetical protein